MIAFMICGTSSGVGKTMVTQSVLSQLIKMNLKVQSFKLGPDYIDSSFHSKITKKPCINLDKFLLTQYGKENEGNQILLNTFLNYYQNNDALIVEAVGGIFDDFNNSGNSPYDIAKILNINILLVADGYASSQTLGYMLNGLLKHDKVDMIKSVIINKVASKQHFETIISSIKKENIQLNYLPINKNLYINERHLGLVTEKEYKIDNNHIENLNLLFSKYFDQNIYNKFKLKNIKTNNNLILKNEKKEVKIAVAKDKAFSFYYDYNVKYLESLGAEIIYFSPLNDKKLPNDIDGIYFGGGFPEVHAQKLSENSKLKDEIKKMAINNMPIYAECGGLMYLSNFIEEYETRKLKKMVGIFNFSIEFSEALSLGYCYKTLLENCVIGKNGDIIKGHVFHKTGIKNISEYKSVSKLKFLHNNKIFNGGYMFKNTYASYLHVHFQGSPNLAENFIENIKKYHENKFLNKN